MAMGMVIAIGAGVVGAGAIAFGITRLLSGGDKITEDVEDISENMVDFAEVIRKIVIVLAIVGILGFAMWWVYKMGWFQ